MAEYEKEINKLKDDLDKAKNLRIRAEARLEQLNKQKQDILSEIEGLGVKPENLENQIELLQKEIEELIRKANGMLPEDLLK